MTQRARPFVYVASLLLVTGCLGPTGAVLELYLELPPSSDAFNSALVQVRRWEPGVFSAEWRSEQDVEPVPLSAEPTRDHVSVTTELAEGDLALRVSFCRNPDCSDDPVLRPERHYRLHEPFFVGQRVEWHARIDAPMSAEAFEDVDRCEMRGCVTGDLVPDYCDEQGRHPCD